MAEVLALIRRMVVDGNFREIEAQVGKALEAGFDPQRIINEALISAMDIVGKRFSDGEIYVPEMLVSATAMKRGLEIIKPLLSGGGEKPRGTIVMATVKGDLHDIGKNLVTMMLEGAGFQVIDLGVDAKVEDLVGIVREKAVDILGLSALLTTTMPEMQRVIEVLETEGLREKVRVMVGGAPIDQAFAEQIGADGYGADAVEAVKLARRFIPESRQS